MSFTYFFSAKPVVLCDAPVDVVFVIDTTANHPTRFASIKTALKNVAGGFSFNETGPRAALVSFSNQALMQLPFELYENPSSLKSAIDLLSVGNKERNISNGLKETFGYLTGQSTRKRNSTLVYLVTTGHQATGPGSIPPSFIAESFHELGIKILALGIGDDVKEDVLTKITKDSTLVNVVKNPKELEGKDFWSNITKDICYASGKPSSVHSSLSIKIR